MQTTKRKMVKGLGRNGAASDQFQPLTEQATTISGIPAPGFTLLLVAGPEQPPQTPLYRL